MIYSRIELSGAQAGGIYTGKEARISAVMSRSEEISKRKMKEALELIGERTQKALEDVSPVGKGNPGTENYGGSSPPRIPGTLKRSWSHEVRSLGDDAILIVGSSDPVSEYVDKGTGLYRVGGGSRGLIRPSQGAVMGVPASALKIGGSKARRGGKKVTLDVRWLKSTRGIRPQRLVERAQISVRPQFGAILRTAAYEAKREMVRALRST